MKKTFVTAMLAFAMIAFVGCRETEKKADEAAEDLTEEAGSMTEAAEKTMTEAGEAIEEAANEAGEAVEEAVNEAGEAVEEAVDSTVSKAKTMVKEAAGDN